MAMGFQPVVSLWRHRLAAKPAARDWSQEELAQFHRVLWALGQAGIGVETERGLSDEGDPWFAFCRQSDGEVVVHIAREGSLYVLAGFLSDGVERGRDFGELVEKLLARHPSKSIDRRERDNVVMHPATMLALLVSIAILQNSGEGHASEQPEDGRADVHRPQPSSPAAALPAGRIAQATAAVPTPLVATLELAQAMSILMVASFAAQGPAQAAVPGAETGLATSFPGMSTLTHGGAHELHRQTLSTVKDAAATASGSHSAGAPPLEGQAGIEKLLEVVAKLWTLPDGAAAVTPALTVEAASAFFFGRAPEPVTIQAAAAGATASAASSEHAQAGHAVEAPAETVTIVHTPATSETTAQTMLKLTLAQQGDMTVRTSAADDPAKLYSLVSEIVSHAKASEGLEVGKAALGLILKKLDTLGQTSDDAAPQPDAKAETIPTTDLDTSPAASEPEAYKTSISGSTIRHDVLIDEAVKTTIERAVSAFKEDVGHVDIAVAGKDVIYYSPDAVIHHSTKVVVELWQFKDGSSISLVGLSLDGPLPYSL